MSQQNANLLLSTIGGDDFIFASEESFIYEGHITKDDVLLEELNSGQDVALNIEIENTIDLLDEYTVRLVNPSGTEYFGYKIENGSITIEDSFGSFLITSNPGSGYFLDIVRCDNTIFYVHENKILFCRELSSNTNQLNGHVHVDEAIEAGVDVYINAPLDCEYICELIKEDFLVLDDFLTWREHVMVDTILQFKYVEKYSIAAAYNDSIYCQLLDDKNNMLFAENRSNQYGINLQEWSIPGSLFTTGNYYVFRVSGMNKGKVYNVRIRYDGN